MEKFKKEILLHYSERDNIKNIVFTQTSALREVFGNNSKITHRVIGENPPPMWKECETHYEDYLRSNGEISIQFQVEY